MRTLVPFMTLIALTTGCAQDYEFTAPETPPEVAPSDEEIEEEVLTVPESDPAQCKFYLEPGQENPFSTILHADQVDIEGRMFTKEWMVGDTWYRVEFQTDMYLRADDCGDVVIDGYTLRLHHPHKYAYDDEFCNGISGNVFGDNDTTELWSGEQVAIAAWTSGYHDGDSIVLDLDYITDGDMFPEVRIPAGETLLIKSPKLIEHFEIGDEFQMELEKVKWHAAESGEGSDQAMGELPAWSEPFTAH